LGGGEAKGDHKEYNKCFGICKRNGKQEPGSKKQRELKTDRQTDRQPEKVERKRKITGNKLFWLPSNNTLVERLMTDSFVRPTVGL
jgi:hypothetical protein